MVVNTTHCQNNTEQDNMTLSNCIDNATLNKAIESISRDQRVVIVTYWVLMILGGFSNLVVLVCLARTRRRKLGVDLLMMHLAIADVSVTCGVIPLEIGWKTTNEWLVGNALCKVLLVMRAFGLYLSSNVLICISIDRFFAVLYPLKIRLACKRSQHMLYCAWAMALLCSLPQSLVFRVLEHPQVKGFEQCVSFGAFATMALEVAYNVACLCAMYFVPLVIISVCYFCIFWKIRRCTNDLNGVRLRRSDHRLLERARRRTLQMTIIIVTVFAFCWLPYAVMTMWYMIDRDSASHVSSQVQDLLFAMAVSNSCMNPLVYGSYTLRSNETFQKLFKKTCCWSNNSTATIGDTGLISHKRKNRNYDNPAMELNQNGNPRTRRGVRFAETSFTEPRRVQETRTSRGPA